MSIPNSPPTHSDAHHQAVLQDLIDMGHDLARAIHRRAVADATAAAEAGTAALPPTPASEAPGFTPDPTVAFDRIARCIRRTIALARHLATNEAARTQAAPDPATRAARRAQLIRGVEDAIHVRRRSDHAEADALYAELAERLDDPELELDLQGRSVDEMIEEICRDLGVAKQGRAYVWRRRTPQDIASLRARAAAPTPGQAATLQLIQGGKPEPAPPPSS